MVAHVATDEMLHLALVQNLLSAIGAAPHLARPNLPAPARHYPAGVNLTLVPFGGMGPTIAGLVLIAAGLYQLTPFKYACLTHCQSPLTFILHHWRPGRAGAFRMGIEHGGFCLGCCWFLMALLFFGGIMNLIWIAGIAIYVGIEKFAAGHRWLTIAVGVSLIVVGLKIVVSSFLAV